MTDPEEPPMTKGAERILRWSFLSGLVSLALALVLVAASRLT